MRPLLLAAILVAASASQAAAQRVIAGVRNIPPHTLSALGGGDFDGDGRADVFITGELSDGEPHSALYRFVEREVVVIPNQAPLITAVYQEVEFPIRNVARGSVEWADMDGDGDEDVLVTGRSLEEVTTDRREFRVNTDIYINSSGNTLLIDQANGLPDVYDSKAVPAHMNDDDRMDVVIGGRTLEGDLVFGVYLNDGSGGYRPAATTFPGLIPSTLAVGDIDGDGDNDFVVGGLDANAKTVFSIYDNEGGEVFSLREGALPELYFPIASLGDLDRDGDDDLLISGGILSPTIMRGHSALYMSEDGQLVERTDIELPQVFKGSASFGDIDGDNDIDFYIEGISNVASEEGQEIGVYENIDGFLLRTVDGRSVLFGAVGWHDYDGNGRLDLLLTGIRSGTRIISYFEL